MNALRLLLCTDLDRTLLPNGTAPESAQARALFAQLADRPNVTLAYVSGRHLQLLDEAIAEYRLPIPDYAITDVGTKIRARADNAWHAWTDWEQVIEVDWAGLRAPALAALFADIPALRLQEPTKQNAHKLSYYVPEDIAQACVERAMQRRLRARGIRAIFVWSVDETAGVGLLDLLPARATKLHAIEFLCQRLGYSRHETLFAGDSGNDLTVLTSDIPSVLVANATPDVREAALAGAAGANHSQTLYLAKGGFLGMNGNYSAGILEGLAHFYPERAYGLEQQS